MKLKHKIRVGFGLIFITNLLAGSLSIYYIERLSEGAKVVLKNNYESLTFARDMRTTLDDNAIPLNGTAKAAFDHSLVKQEHNVTEKGEDLATASLRKDFDQLETATANSPQLQNSLHAVRVDLRNIEHLNMQAIVQKHTAAEGSVNKATIILGLIGCLTFLALFSFSVNISGFISDPLIALSDGLDEVGRKNFDHRLHFTKSDEFAAVSDAFNEMAVNLRKHDHDSISEVLAQKQRVEAILEQMHDAVIILNEKQELVHINTEARNLLDLHEQRIIGKPAKQFAANNKLFQNILDTEDDLTSLKIKLDGKESVFQLESVKLYIPNLAGIRPDEVNIARVSAGRIYVLRNLTEIHAI
ncbi:MAG TPA: HAMP domain-containing protein [Mucilaginibacter sp.]|nr:HAMP domain-containing protein [Mucilaginibacter sp.]